MPPRDHGWNPIESAPLDEDIALQVTDGAWRALHAPMAMSAHSDGLDQFKEGNAAGGHAREVETVPDSAASSSITSRCFPALWPLTVRPCGARERAPTADAGRQRSAAYLPPCEGPWKVRHESGSAPSLVRRERRTSALADCAPHSTGDLCA
jgi:hypothetical protein